MGRKKKVVTAELITIKNNLIQSFKLQNRKKVKFRN